MTKELRMVEACAVEGRSSLRSAGDGGGVAMQQDEDVQCTGRSRPVSFYDNFKDIGAMPPCITSAMSVGNLSQRIRDNENNETTNSGGNATNNNNRVSSAVSVGNVSKIQGTKVTGALSTGNIGWITRSERDKELGRAPSMANCLSTTVPVNLAASQIAGRHTPTRNSLRHSRMIVMHRTGNATRKSQPPLLRHRRLARSLAGMQIFLGIAVTSLALWLLLWAPNLPLVDNPYWSGMPLLLSGSFGICLLCCFKKEYPGMSPGCCLTATKITSVCLAILSTVACVVACVAATMHLAKLTGLECTPARVRNATCACRPRTDLASPSEPLLKYVDLNCPEVEGVLMILLIFSAACNGIGAITAGTYCYLHWCTREKRPKYIQVRTSSSNGPPSSIVTRSIYNSSPGGR